MPIIESHAAEVDKVLNDGGFGIHMKTSLKRGLQIAELDHDYRCTGIAERRKRAQKLIRRLCRRYLFLWRFRIGFLLPVQCQCNRSFSKINAGIYRAYGKYE